VNVDEGLHRIATAVRVCGWLVAAAALAISLAVLLWAALSAVSAGKEIKEIDEIFWVWLLLAAGCAAVSLGVGLPLAWIIDGFAKPRDPPAG